MKFFNLKTACKALLVLVLTSIATLPLSVQAQIEATITPNIQQLSAEEVKDLRDTLSSSWITFSNTILTIQIMRKLRAARLLDDNSETIRILEFAAKSYPRELPYRHDLAIAYFKAGRFVEGKSSLEVVINNSTGVAKAARVAIYINLLISTYQSEDTAKAKKWILILEKYFEDFLKTPQKPESELEICKIQALVLLPKADISLKEGRINEAHIAYISAMHRTQKCLDSVQLSSISNVQKNAQIFAIANLLAATFQRQAISFSNLGRLQEFNAIAYQYSELSKKYNLSKENIAVLYGLFALSSYDQRNFSDASKWLDKSLSILDFDTKNISKTISPTLRTLLTGKAEIELANKNFEKSLGIGLIVDSHASSNIVNPLLKTPIIGLNLYHLGRFGESVASLNRQIDANQFRNSFDLFQTQCIKAASLWRINTPESRTQAWPMLQQAVAGYMSPVYADYLENIGIRKEIRELIFAAYVEAAASQPNKDMALQAFTPSDWVRSGVVQEALNDAATRSAFNNPAQQDLVRKEQDAKNEIRGLRSFLSGESGAASRAPLPEIAAKMRARIDELEKERVKLQAQIKAQFPDYDKLVRPSAVKPSDVQARLENNEALVSILPTDSGTFTWTFTKDGAQFQKSTLTAEKIAALVKQLRATLDVAGLASTPAFNAAVSSQLYDELIRPFSNLLAGKSHVVVAAGGALAQIPMGVLLTAPVASPQNYWISQTAITHVPSATAWLAVKRSGDTTHAKEAFFGVGDPVFNTKLLAQADGSQANKNGAYRNINLTRASTSFDLDKPAVASAVTYSMLSALPETRDEIKAIADVLKADAQKDTLFGANANKTELLKLNTSGRLQTKRVLSFATHGLVTGDLPNLNQPALALSVPKDYDEKNHALENVAKPLLMLEDVLGLKLNADWVVLSACNTAAADGKGEEALSGLARGFFYAGAKSVLATHWAVDSDSAAALTTNTFAHYTANPNAPKAESLRAAMLKVMNDKDNKHWAHPAYWAPFALVGDGGR